MDEQTNPTKVEETTATRRGIAKGAAAAGLAALFASVAAGRVLAHDGSDDTQDVDDTADTVPEVDDTADTAADDEDGADTTPDDAGTTTKTKGKGTSKKRGRGQSRKGGKH
jgi:hypothetical protein